MIKIINLLAIAILLVSIGGCGLKGQLYDPFNQLKYNKQNAITK